MEFFEIDPYAEGFFADEDAELAERVGYALKCAAPHLPIRFDRNLMPEVDARSHGCGGGFSYGMGFCYSNGELENTVAAHPEFEEKIRENDRKYGVFMAAAHDLPRLERYEALSSGCAMWGGGWAGHSNPDFGRIVNLGTDGIRKLIDEYEKVNAEDSDWFYRGCRYTLDAVDILGDRFRALAEKLAAECADPADKKRYADAARAFSVAPRKPCPDFTAAALVFWMIFTLDGIDSPGRFDQYMRRAWDASDGDGDGDGRLDALSRLWECFHDTRTWNLCISGSDENWNDATNSLSYAILKIARERKYETPNLTMRVHRNTPEKLWDEAAETLASGIGMPAIYNDEVVCASLEKIGIPPCDSHLYCMNGCNQIDVMGKSHMGLEDGEVNFGKCLEYALHDGYNEMRGRYDSINTGDAASFTSYEEMERAFMRQLEYVTYMACQAADICQHTRGIFQPNPLRSCLLEGCLERGIDYRNGGPLYNHGQILAEAIADAGDSLFAIKKLVFDEKKYTMAELISALKANFEGYGELYYDFSHCDKFGNDSGEVDEITSRIVNRFFRILKRNHTYRGGVFTGGCSPDDRAAYYGANIAALPNGKKKGEPLIADCIAAVPGCDVNGPTSVIKSVLNYEHVNCCSGFIFMMKFDKKVFCTPKGKEAFKHLAKAYFAGGGQQYTVTVVSPEELLDAKVHPERHRDLIVRVGGFSGYFVDLDEGLQDNVIARSFNDMGI